MPKINQIDSLRTADVSPRSSPLRDISRGGTSATQRQRFHTDDVNQFLHNKSGSHGFQMQICSILRFSWSILVKCCVHMRISSSTKLKCFFQRRLYSTNIGCFVRNSSRLHLTFAAFCLLSLIRKQ